MALKNVKQFNSVHGDNPNVTPPNIPPPPQNPSFGSVKNKLDKRNVEVVGDDLEFTPMGVDWDTLKIFEELSSGDVEKDSASMPHLH